MIEVEQAGAAARPSRDTNPPPDATPAGREHRTPIAWRAGGALAAPISFVAADLAALGVAVAIAHPIRTAVWGAHSYHAAFWITAVVWIVFRYAARLLPPYRMAPASELRRSTMTTLAAMVTHGALIIAAGESSAWRLFGVATWLFAIPLSWFTRSMTRTLLIKTGLYGFPVAILGTGEKARQAIREMRANRDAGFVPVAAFGDAPELWGRDIEGVPVLGPLDGAAAHAFPYRVVDGILALSRGEAGAAEILAYSRRFAVRFRKLHLLSDLVGMNNLWVFPHPIGSYLALETQHARYSRRSRFVKRAFDLLVGVPVFLVALPIVLVAAAAVKLVSPGAPAFFSQLREGRDGRPIRIWKIRSMVPNAEGRLAEYLAGNAAARAEYTRTLKLRHDPRVLPYVGAFIRRASIDELPQLWSVLTGEMSLVGPRIMPTREVEQFSAEPRQTRREVTPGLTGLWQINFRNNSDLRVREVADAYYVNNWSVWLDLWILLRTVRVVFFGSGAY